jgi:hypothetical protein
MTDNTVSGIFGIRGTGKTSYLKGDKEFNLPGIFPVYQKKNMKVLIVDTFDHPKYRDITYLTPRKLVAFKEGIARTYVRPDQMPDLTRLICECNSLWNTLIVYEDAQKHQHKVLDRPTIRLIGDSKQKNMDIVFMFHNWFQAPKDLYLYLNYIEVFKTKDSPESRRESIQQAGYFDEAMSVYNEVKAHDSKYYHKFLDTGL